MKSKKALNNIMEKYPEKFIETGEIFRKINRGDRIFISTACGEPQYLVNSLVKYVESNPKAFYDTEIFHVWTLGVSAYTDAKFKYNFRHNSFFIGNNTREAINEGLADYTPVFLSQTPALFNRKLVNFDVALIQTSLPDEHGYLSLGVSVDICKAAIENAAMIIVQINEKMPRVLGDSFIHIDKVDYAVSHDEPLLEFEAKVSDEIAQRIGKFAARIINDGDTIQVGYGSIPNALLKELKNKKNLGVHTELLSEGLIELMKNGNIDNSLKTINRGKTVASFCMGHEDTYDFVHDNPSIAFRTIDYVNNPLNIAQHQNMTAINSALQIDLSGQATAESLGKTFYSGIGGSADFMRGAILAPGGKTILVMQSTASKGEISRIVPVLSEGAGVTLGRGDIHYVVTEYGIAYLHGKNIRERAMDLIAIAHPKFRPELIEKAKELNIIYQDQMFIPGERGMYPENLESYRKTRTGLELFLRPVKISDEPLVKDFFYSLSDTSLYRRFISLRTDMPHERLQEFVVIDYTKEMVILAIQKDEHKEVIVGLGQYIIEEDEHRAEVAFTVRDDFQNQGIGTELLTYLTHLGVRQGLKGFSAEVLFENRNMLHLFEKMGFEMEKHISEGAYELNMLFRTSTS